MTKHVHMPLNGSLTTNTKVWKIMTVIFILLTTFFALCFYFKTIFLTFVLGGALILITEKIGDFFHKRTARFKSKWTRKLYRYGIILISLVLILYMIGGSLEQMAVALSEINQDGQTVGQYYLENIDPMVPPFVKQNLVSPDTIRDLEFYVLGLFSSLFQNLSALALNAILIIPLMFYMYFRKKEDITKKIFDLAPKKFHRGVKYAIGDIRTQLHEFFDAKGTESLVIGIICCIGFFMAGLKGWLILGLFAGFLNIVPYIGPVLGAIPPLVIGLLIQGPWAALYVIITIVVAQLIDNLYLIPFMISNKVKIDALLSIILILVGAQLFGALGMIFAIPVYLVYKVVLRESYEELVNIYGQK